MTEPIRIIVCDDHTIVRTGVRLVLEAEPDIDVVGEAGNGLEALELVEKLQPNVVLIDIAMPEMDGLEATQRIKERWPQINVLVLTMHRTEEYFFQTLRAGASGFVLKGAETSELLNAVRIVSRGEVYLYSKMAQKLVQAYLQRNDQPDDLDVLSPREREILVLLAEGYSNNEIAEKLVISPSTVHTHRGNIMSKLELNSHRELIQYARKRGLAP